MTARRLLLLTVLPALLLVACGDDGGGEELQEATDLMDEADIADLTDESDPSVDARDNVFNEKYVEVSKGTTVTFENAGENVHNVLPVEDGAFTPIDADEFDPGDTGTITFDEAGDFPYYCSLHGTKTKGMIGGVRVVE
jgi:plastocyanin